MKSNFAVLINQYRAVFGEDDLPFLCVQLARYSSGNPIRAHRSAGAARRAGQCGSEHDGEHLAMTVSIDTDKGTSKVIHPLGKDILAARMATQWLAMTDSRESSESTVPSGPLARRASAMEEDASTGTVTFAEGTAKGLRAMTPNYITKATATNLVKSASNPLQGFEVAGQDGVFYTADASIQGNTVIVHSDEVTKISQVCYLWGLAPNSSSMLYNSVNLPASPFLLGVGKE